ncbi:AI-2E family transporter [Pseudoruegeria sp. SK021]|uniref:AI-2E family transporter n=1 Tax=Pseudoruegeria sp. SK021 TaxID=1933035 RepID=UPI000A2452ED|nr:AI-2E family transporter [Pseudoruegeria sp. SK021]OSP54052.1 hypothetical protein BV911_14650 [Pseudoruegeria sp. SK021]
MYPEPTKPGPVRSPEQLATDIAIRLGLLGAFLYLALALIHPFLGILIWSVVLAVALFPVFCWLRDRLGGRSRLAACLITALSLMIVFGPMVLLSTSLVSTLEQLAHAIRSGNFVTPAPPKELDQIPMIGPDLTKAWAWTAVNLTSLLEKYAHTLLVPGEWLLKTVAALAGSILIFAISAVLSGCLFLWGADLTLVLRDVAQRIAGPHGLVFLNITGTTIRSVARGIIGVAVLEALVIGVVLVMAGVPHAGFLAGTALFLAVVQIGTFPIIFPLIIWVWLSHDTAQAILLMLALTPVAILDYVVKPLAMGQGLDTPIFIIIIGVFGGTLVFGITGLFIGPIVLAVFYDLLNYWRGQGSMPS